MDLSNLPDLTSLQLTSRWERDAIALSAFFAALREHLHSLAISYKVMYFASVGGRDK